MKKKKSRIVAAIGRAGLTKPYTPDEFRALVVRMGAIRAAITWVERRPVDGKPEIVVYYSGLKRGVILDREHAMELTEALGPHPLVEEHFKLH